MPTSFDHYQQFADLFLYPEKGYHQKTKDIQLFLDEHYPQAGRELQAFTRFIERPAATLQYLEELFTRSFDVQAITTLDIGYVLFGEDYKRGMLLVNLNREHQDAGNVCQGELADHFPHILRLLSKMNKPDLRKELVLKIIAPALRKIIAEFDPQKLTQKRAVYQKHHKTLIESSQNYGTIYQHPLKAVYRVLEEDFSMGNHAAKEEVLTPQSADFIKSVKNEMNIESQ